MVCTIATEGNNMARNHRIQVSSFTAAANEDGILLNIDFGSNHRERLKAFQAIASIFVADRVKELREDRTKVNNAINHANTVMDYMGRIEGGYKSMSDERLGRYAREMLANTAAAKSKATA